MTGPGGMSFMDGRLRTGIKRLNAPRKNLCGAFHSGSPRGFTGPLPSSVKSPLDHYDYLAISCSTHNHEVSPMVDMGTVGSQHC